MKLSEIIKFELYRDSQGRPTGRGNFVLGSDRGGHQYTASDVDELLQSTLKEYRGDVRKQMSVLAQTIVEPIQTIVPYAEMFNMFFSNVQYGGLEDNSLP